MCQIEFDNLPVFGSLKIPEALHRGSSGKRDRNLSSLFLNVKTGLSDMELMFGGRQFQRLLAVSAKDELRGISAGLW